MFFLWSKIKNKSLTSNNLLIRKGDFYSWKSIQENMHPKKNGEKRNISKKIKSFLKKAGVFCIDHWHILIKSAAHNHLRIQKCKNEFKYSEACNLSFQSYSHLKRYQKKVRLITFSSSSTIISVFIAMIVVQVFFPSLKTRGATFTFGQTSWVGGATANTADHTDNQTGWNQYGEKDVSVVVVNGGADLQLALPAVQSVQDDSDAQFNGTQTGDGFYTDGTGKLYLKKPTTATCTEAGQCASGICSGNICQ